MKNFFLSFQHQALSKTQKQLVMHDLQQTKPNKKKKEVKWMVPLEVVAHNWIALQTWMMKSKKLANSNNAAEVNDQHTLHP